MTVSSRIDSAADSPKFQANFMGATAAVVILMGLFLTPRTVPVVLNERASNIEVTDDYVEFDVDAVGWRDCDVIFKNSREFVRDAKIVAQHRAEIRGNAGRWFETWMEFVDEDVAGSTRLGDISLELHGRWRVWYPRAMESPPMATKLPVIHLCGKGRDIPYRSVMGPFRLGK